MLKQHPLRKRAKAEVASPAGSPPASAGLPPEGSHPAAPENRGSADGLATFAEALRYEGARTALPGPPLRPGSGKWLATGRVALLPAALIGWGARRLGLLSPLHPQLPG